MASDKISRASKAVDTVRDKLIALGASMLDGRMVTADEALEARSACELELGALLDQLSTLEPKQAVRVAERTRRYLAAAHVDHPSLDAKLGELIALVEARTSKTIPRPLPESLEALIGPGAPGSVFVRRSPPAHASEIEAYRGKGAEAWPDDLIDLYRHSNGLVIARGASYFLLIPPVAELGLSDDGGLRRWEGFTASAVLCESSEDILYLSFFVTGNDGRLCWVDDSGFGEDYPSRRTRHASLPELVEFALRLAERSARDITAWDAFLGTRAYITVHDSGSTYRHSRVRRKREPRNILSCFVAPSLGLDSRVRARGG